MDRFLIMLIRTGGGGNKSSSFTGKGKNGKEPKEEKEDRFEGKHSEKLGERLDTDRPKGQCVMN